MVRSGRTWVLGLLGALILEAIPRAAAAQAVMGTGGGSAQIVIFSSPNVGLPNPAFTTVPRTAAQGRFLTAFPTTDPTTRSCRTPTTPGSPSVAGAPVNVPTLSYPMLVLLAVSLAIAAMLLIARKL